MGGRGGRSGRGRGKAWFLQQNRRELCVQGVLGSLGAPQQIRFAASKDSGGLHPLPFYSSGAARASDTLLPALAATLRPQCLCIRNVINCRSLIT